MRRRSRRIYALCFWGIHRSFDSPSSALRATRTSLRMTILINLQYRRSSYAVVLQRVQGLVRLVQRKDLHLGVNRDLSCHAHEIMAVFPRVVCHAADGAFLINQRVRKIWNITHLDSALNHIPALLERGERGWNQLAGGRED